MSGTHLHYTDDLVDLYLGDARDIWGDHIDGGPGSCLIVDPPWDDTELLDWVETANLEDRDSTLVFTDGRRLADPIRRFGPPDHLFVWDTLNTWSVSPNVPVQQTKHALYYQGPTSTGYQRDATLHGRPPPPRSHPTTTQIPLDGRRLTDLWRESLRWLHHPGPGNGSAGTERFTTRQGHPALRHAKPEAWVRCLIGNTSRGTVIDPFAGSGTSLVAARTLGRRAIGVEYDPAIADYAAERLAQPDPIDEAQGVLDLNGGTA